MNKFNALLELIRKYGIFVFLVECYYHLIGIYYERYFNVNTRGYVSRDELEITDEESLHYAATHYKHVFTLLNKLPVDKNNSTLLDYGCGKARVIIVAASYQYRRIIGVEISKLINLAKFNVQNMKHRKIKNVLLLQCDATSFDVPSDVNIIFFSNPFVGSILEKVISNIHASYQDSPRKIYIISIFNDDFDRIIAHQNWLSKSDQLMIHPQMPCGLYETNCSGPIT